MGHYDVIVVGAGGTMGSSAMYHLARSGSKVLGLEAQPQAPHTAGSHHGLTRIIRLAYAEHPCYVPLLKRAFELWRQLEVESGQDLLKETGCINMSPKSLPDSCFKGAQASAQLHGLTHEVLTPAELQGRCPGYAPPEDFQIILEPVGGVLCPERCIAAHLAGAAAAGAEVLYGAAVTRWGVEPGGQVSVQAGPDAQTHTADRLILAPGAWLPRLVPELKSLLTVERQVVGWFDIEGDASHFSPDSFPVAVLDDETGMFYAFPADAHGFKIGKMHHRRQVTEPDALDRAIVPEDEATLRVAVQRYFPGAAGRLNHAAACLFTNTPDEDFVIDVHPRHPQVVICSACSGHGFKFGSVIGEVLKDLALMGGTPLDIDFLRLSSLRKGQAAVLEEFGKQEPASA
ncbi:SOX1B [Auxenochlorella protothecoides x Auxenochlorella symbiontica]